MGYKTLDNLYGLKKGRKNQRALDVFLRNSYRTHTGLSALADRKANILIRFNSILISILLIFFKEIIEMNPSIFISGFIFLFTSLVSLLFATMAARPHVTKLNNSPLKSLNEIKRDIFFFGNFVDLPLPRYEEAFNEMLQDNRVIYGNMIRDIYYLGKILDVKFKYITWSYNVFLVGLTLTVLAFIISFFLSNGAGF